MSIASFFSCLSWIRIRGFLIGTCHSIEEDTVSYGIAIRKLGTRILVVWQVSRANKLARTRTGYKKSQAYRNNVVSITYGDGTLKHGRCRKVAFSGISTHCTLVWFHKLTE